jgi:hypothetical protein
VNFRTAATLCKSCSYTRLQSSMQLKSMVHDHSKTGISLNDVFVPIAVVAAELSDDCILVRLPTEPEPFI